MKSMSLKKYFEITKPTYVYLKLTPTYSVRNQSTEQIAKAVCSLYRSITQSIHRYEKKFFVEARSKVAYYIYLEQGVAEFYFILPQTYEQLLKEKIQNSWKGITIKTVEKVPMFTKDSTQYYLTYKKEDGLSLTVDKRANTLLSSLMNVIPVLKEGDRLGIFYNFVPCSQMSWRADYEKTIDKIKNGIPVDRQKTDTWYIVKMLAYLLVYVIEMAEDAIFSLTKTEKKDNGVTDMIFRKLNMTELTPHTIQKKESMIIDTQIAVFSESKDRIQANNNARAICTSFQAISGDNELIYKKKKPTDLKPEKLYIESTDSIKVSTSECHNFLQLPGRDLLEEHSCVEKIETQETPVPEPLQTGVMCVGDNTYRGTMQRAFLSTDSEYQNLTLCVAGPTRAGKSTLLQNLTKDAIDNGECVIVPDFISWCKLSHELRQVIPENKQLVIDLEDLENLPGFGFNELWLETDNALDKYDSAKRQTSQLATLIDSINEKDLSGKMDRHIKSAALVVFSCYGSFNDVFGVLRDHRKRYEYFAKVPDELKERLGEYIENLKELDDKDKNGNVTGTKTHLVAGILDRVNKMKDNTAMEFMLDSSCEGNVNLLEEIQKPQLIVIRMPDSKFSTKEEKDIICSYWFSKIWLTLQLRDDLIRDRKKRVKVNIIWDELYQVPYTQGLLAKKLSQIAKFDCKNIVSCHYLDQIPIIKPELTGANTSYMLLQGCDEKNYKELANVLKPYTVEDLINLKRYHSLNSIKYEGGYAKFITKMPKPIQ